MVLISYPVSTVVMAGLAMLVGNLPTQTALTWGAAAGLAMAPPGDTIAVLRAPIFGCRVEFKVPEHSSSSISTLRPRTGGSDWQMTLVNVEYVANGWCPYSGGSDGVYAFNAPLFFPGVSVNEL